MMVRILVIKVEILFYINNLRGMWVGIFFVFICMEGESYNI